MTLKKKLKYLRIDFDSEIR